MLRRRILHTTMRLRCHVFLLACERQSEEEWSAGTQRSVAWLLHCLSLCFAYLFPVSVANDHKSRAGVPGVAGRLGTSKNNYFFEEAFFSRVSADFFGGVFFAFWGCFCAFGGCFCSFGGVFLFFWGVFLFHTKFFTQKVRQYAYVNPAG